MCAWAISMSGISTVYFGSYNQQYGALESKVHLPINPNLKTYGGIEEEICNKILEEFFENIRK
jgi:tRNA(Arg) A34 adenosine deaminase TadA